MCERCEKIKYKYGTKSQMWYSRTNLNRHPQNWKKKDISYLFDWRHSTTKSCQRSYDRNNIWAGGLNKDIYFAW